MVLKKKSLNRQQATSKISQHVPPSSDPRDIASRSATSLSNIIVRPLIAAAGSLMYGYYMDNRIFASNKELMRAGLLGGSVFASNAIGNMLLPTAFIPKVNGQRNIDSMAVESITTGLTYTAGTYFLIDQDVNQLVGAFTRGAVIDLAAGATEAITSPFLPF